MEPVTVVLRSKRQRRAAAVQKLQHLAPATILLGQGLTTFRGHAEGAELAIAVFSVIAGALFMLGALRGIHTAVSKSAAHGHHGIDWTDIFAAAVVAVETLEHYHRTGHLKRPGVLMIATLLFLAVFHDRLIAL